MRSKRIIVCLGGIVLLIVINWLYFYVFFTDGSAGSVKRIALETQVSKKFRFLAIDNHPTLNYDMKHILQDLLRGEFSFDIEFKIQDMGSYCEFFKESGQSICVEEKTIPGYRLSSTGGFQERLNLCPRPHQVRKNFFNGFKNTLMFEKVDVFTHIIPPAGAQLYLPFNRSVIVFISVPWNVGRKVSYWTQEWKQELLAISQSEHHMIICNNRHDQHRTWKDVGLKHPPLLVSNLCDYGKNAKYSINKIYPTCRILVIPSASAKIRKFKPSHFQEDYVIQELRNKFSKSSKDCEIVVGFEKVITSLFSSSGSGKKKIITTPELYSEVVKFHAVVIFPWSYSLSTMFELHATNMPVYVPHCEFIQTEYFSHMVDKSDVMDACRFGRADWFHFGNFIQFKKMEHIVQSFVEMDKEVFVRTSRIRFSEFRETVLDQWKKIMKKLKNNKLTRGVIPKSMSLGEAMETQFPQLRKEHYDDEDPKCVSFRRPQESSQQSQDSTKK